MSEKRDRNFVLGQGLTPPASCGLLTSALLFQPRVVGVWVLAGGILRSPAVLAVLAALLEWSALLPRLSPFDAVHNALLAGRAGRPRLEPSPGPRRFAQSLAGILAALAAAGHAEGWHGFAFAMEATLLAAVAALVFGRFCFGSFVYYLARGEVRFAFQTLPWGRGA